MKEVYVIDACGLIAYLTQEEGAEKVQAVLKEARKNRCKIFMNRLNLLEVFYVMYQDEGKEKADEIYGKILTLPIKIIDGIKKKVFNEAGRLKATYSISLADSVVLAETISRKAKVITSDHHEFDEIEEKEDSIRFFWIR